MKPTAVTLSEEILVKIIRECIEPYSVDVTQTWYGENNAHAVPRLTRIGNSRERAIGDHNQTPLANTKSRHGHQHQQPQQQYKGLGKTVPVDEFSISKGYYWYGPGKNDIEILSGFPDTLNLKLVNKMFFIETDLALRNKFDGKVHIKRDGNMVQSCILPDTIRSGDELLWLKPKIKQVTISEADLQFITTTILDTDQSPELETLILRTRLSSYFTPREIKCLMDNQDTSALKIFQDRWVAGIADDAEWLDILALHGRDVDIQVRAKIYAGPVLVRGEEESTLKGCYLRMDIPHAGPIVLKGRKKVNLPLWDCVDIDIWEDI